MLSPHSSNGKTAQVLEPNYRAAESRLTEASHRGGEKCCEVATDEDIWFGRVGYEFHNFAARLHHGLSRLRRPAHSNLKSMDR